jgi:CHAP domain-containing protein/putative peptidoglycan binding protein
MEYPARVIKAGEADAGIVKAIQVRLTELGFGPLDRRGTFGPETTSAVQLFQTRHLDANGVALKRDGKVGSLTWAALFGDDTVPVATEPRSDFLRAVLARAASQEGVRERPKDSNGGPEVDQYLSRAGVPPTLPAPRKPWCCAFTYWCFDETARAQGRRNPMVRTAGVMDHWNRAASVSGASRLAAARAVADPSLVAPGMLFVIDAGQGHGHTGFVEVVNGGRIRTIEGNTDQSGSREGGGVYRSNRKLADINRGYIDYSGA